MELNRASRAFRSVVLTVASLFVAVSARAQSAPAAGIIILNTVAGSPGGATEFSAIQWAGNDGGFVTDMTGNKVPFTNNAIGRILYFDQAYYEEVDHNQYWQNWRAGLQSREQVIQPIDTVSLHPSDAARLQAEQKQLGDLLSRYPTGRSVLTPMVDTIKQDLDRLAGGLVLENGKWIPAAQATGVSAPSNTVPTIGGSGAQVTFTTKDGRTFQNARVVLTDTGINVLTAEGGGTVTLDQLPDDLSPFPAPLRDKIRAMQSRHHAEVAQANKPPPTWVDTAWGWWQVVSDFFVGIYHNLMGRGSSSTAPVEGTTTTNAPPAAPVAPAAPLSPSDVALTLVEVKGDNAQGTGFLTRMSDGPVVVTNLHLIAENPNVRLFLTNGGREILPGALRGATDRDIAVFAIQDNNYDYLELTTDFTIPKAGDPAIIPGDSTAKGSGELLVVGTQHVEFTNPIRKLSVSGSPIIDGKTNQALAVLGAPDFGEPPKSPTELVGLRIDNVPRWEPYNQYQFVSETLHIKAFHDDTRAIESFLIAQGFAHAVNSSTDGPPDSKYYLGNDKIRGALEKIPLSTGANPPVPSPDLIAALESLAGDGMAELQNPETYYLYNQGRIKTELAYRRDVKNEIDALKNSGQPSLLPILPPPSPLPPPAPSTDTNQPPAPPAAPSAVTPTNSPSEPAPASAPNQMPASSTNAAPAQATPPSPPAPTNAPAPPSSPSTNAAP